MAVLGCLLLTELLIQRQVRLGRFTIESNKIKITTTWRQGISPQWKQQIHFEFYSGYQTDDEVHNTRYHNTGY